MFLFEDEFQFELLPDPRINSVAETIIVTIPATEGTTKPAKATEGAAVHVSICFSVPISMSVPAQVPEIVPDLVPVPDSGRYLVQHI